MSSMLATSSERRTVEAPTLDLRIVPIDSLVPHEEHDHQRAEPLIGRIREAGTWLNPPIVAPLDETRYVILDGANRHYALSHLGYDYILVQVVDYESQQVHLDTWNHVVSGLSWFEFLRNIRQIDQVQVDGVDLLNARAAVARRAVLAYAVLDDDRAYTLNTFDPSIGARTALLRQLVDTYKRSGVLNRINTDLLSRARVDYPDAVGIVVFPHYQPAEILVAARDGLLLPPGISRHVIQGRAMRLHYPLDEFRANHETLEAKNEKLRAWMQERNAQKRVRYYAESTYVFDE
jgi:hypothetical protein